MNPLQSRKLLLLAESELNRAQLVHECHAMADGVHSVTDRARTISVIASTAASLIGDLASFRRGQTMGSEARPSWLQTILKSAGQISTLWRSLRPRGCDQKVE